MKIGLILCSSVSHPQPSTRIAVLNMLPYLKAAGFECKIVFEPVRATETPDLSGVFERVIAENCDVVVFQKVSGPDALRLSRRLRENGIGTVFVVCDLVNPRMAFCTDMTLVNCEYLKSLYPRELQSKIRVVYDGIENPACVKQDWGRHSARILAVLVTSQQLDHVPVVERPPPFTRLRIVGAYRSGIYRLREIRWNYALISPEERLRFSRFLLDRRISCRPWTPEGVYREMLRADIGIVPIDTPADPAPDGGIVPLWMRKSENRLTLKMSAGLPVIATPIPSYEAVIDHGRNGFLARTRRDWCACLAALRDPDRRREIGLAARASVQQTYSMDSQASLLIEALGTLRSKVGTRMFA